MQENLKDPRQAWLHLPLKIKMPFIKSHFPNKGEVISTLFSLEYTLFSLEYVFPNSAA